MIRSLQNKKHLQILIIVGLLLPISEKSNPAASWFILWYKLNKPLIDKYAGQAVQYVASTAVVGKVISHFRGNPENLEFIKEGIQSAVKQSKPVQQVVTRGMKKAIKQMPISTGASKIQAFFNRKNIPIRLPSKTNNIATPTFVLPKLSLPINPATSQTVITMAVAQSVPKQMPASVTIPTPTAVPVAQTKLAASQTILKKLEQKAASIPTERPVTITFQPVIAKGDRVSAQNSFTQSNNMAVNIKCEAIPIQDIKIGDGKDIFNVVGRDKAVKTFILTHKRFLDITDQKLDIASQLSNTPEVIREQLSLISHSIPQYHLNAEFSVKRGMILEHFYDRNGEFQGCHSTNIQKQLKEYANGDLHTWGYSVERIKSWLADKIKNFWSSSKDIIEKIRTHPYNVNLYNFTLQMDANNSEGAAYFLDLIRPNHAFDNCNKCVIYKNMYDSFVSRFFADADPIKLADKLAAASKDHPNAVMRSVFEHGNAILKNCFKNYQDITFPEAITTQKFSDLRTLQIKLAAIQPTGQQKISQIRQGLSYIAHACSDGPHAKIFKTCAQAIHKALSGADATILQCRNFAQTFVLPEAQRIQQEVLPLIGQAAEFLQNAPTIALNDDITLRKNCATSLLSHANILYDALAQGDLTKARFIKEKILPTLSFEYVKAHGNPLEALIDTVSTANQSTSVLQQAITLHALSSIKSPTQSFPTSVACAPIEDKSKNLTPVPGQCAPEPTKIPERGCQVPEPSLPEKQKCPEMPKSEVDRRIAAEIEEAQNRPDSQVPEDGQCNWSKQKRALPFGNKNAEEAKQECGNPNDKKEFEDKKQETFIDTENLRKKLIEDKQITPEQEKAINDFLETLKTLIEKYGKDNVLEALEAYKINLHKACRNSSLLAIDELAQMLSEINTNPLFQTFKHDIAHNGTVNQGSLQEAIAGKACMEQQILGTLERAKNEEHDFVEISSGKPWDVKTARSKSIEGEAIFDLRDFLRSLKKAYSDKFENIIIQVTSLSKEDLKKLFECLSENLTTEELSRTIVIDAKRIENSKTSEELVNLLGKKCQ